MLREKLFKGGVLLLAGCQLLHAAEPLLVTTPRARPMPTTATSQPFLAAARAQQPLDLAARGYAEAELLVSGRANIYEWAVAGSDERVVVRTANQPYATRILVRRPLDARKFSGRVIVELLDSSPQHERAPLWGLSYEHFLRRGDVWVGVTVNPVAAAVLQRYERARYGGLSLAIQQPEGCASPNGVEPGLAWDAIAQVGALLRSSSKENPLLDLNPQRLLAAGYSQGGGYIVTFANALHRRLRLGDGAPIFDGYLHAAGSMAVPLNSCANVQAAGAARTGVPFVTVMTESDFNLAPAARRADSDAADDVFRLFEIAGAGNSGPFAAGMPVSADLAALGLALPAENLCLEPRGNFPLGLALNAIWQQWDELLVQKLPMVSVPQIEAEAGMAPKVDDSGSALGGWRLPLLDVPLARFAGRSMPAVDSDQARQVCALTGAMQRFTAAQLKTLYRDRKEYLRRFIAAVDQAVQARLLVKEDADALKASAVRAVPTF